MRVGFGASVLARGLQHGQLDGIAYYTKELAQELHLKGCALLPVVFGQAKLESLEGFDAQHWGRFSTNALLSAATGCSHLGRTGRASDLDVFHATDHLIPKLRGTPVVATLMDAIPLAHPEWVHSRLRPLQNALWKKTATWAQQVITISEYSKSQITEHFNISPNKISVVSLGVDSRYFEILPARFCEEVLEVFRVPRHYFIFIGTLQPRKNIHRIIQAHQSLSMELRRDFPLVIVGRNGWGSDALINQLHQAAGREPIRWLGAVSDVQKRALLQSSVALVFPSLSEGFGLPVLEAFAGQTPVITSNTTSLPEVASDAALLVDPLEVDEIANAMREVIHNQSLASQLKVAGLARAKQFTWQACAKATFSVYESVVAAKHI